MEFILIILAGLAFLGAIYMCCSAFAVLSTSALDKASRVGVGLTAMNVILALPLAAAGLALHFTVPHFYGDFDLAMPIFYFSGLGCPAVCIVAIYYGVKRIPIFRLYPARLWFKLAVSGILFCWSVWALLSYDLIASS